MFRFIFQPFPTRDPMACEKGHVDVARLLLDKGAEVDRANVGGVTPLWIACSEGHVNAVRLLLKRGAEVDRAIVDGMTPLRIACQEGHVDVAQLLVELVQLRSRFVASTLARSGSGSPSCSMSPRRHARRQSQPVDKLLSEHMKVRRQIQKTYFDLAGDRATGAPQGGHRCHSADVAEGAEEAVHLPVSSGD